MPFCCSCFALSTYLDGEKESKQFCSFSSSHLFIHHEFLTPPTSQIYIAVFHQSSSKVHTLLPKPKVETRLASSHLHPPLQPGVRGTTRSQLHRQDFTLGPCLLPSGAAAGAEHWWWAATGEKRPKIMCFRGGNGWGGDQ